MFVSVKTAPEGTAVLTLSYAQSALIDVVVAPSVGVLEIALCWICVSVKTAFEGTFTPTVLPSTVPASTSKPSI